MSLGYDVKGRLCQMSKFLARIPRRGDALVLTMR